MKCRLALVLGVLAVAAGCQKTESSTEIVLEISTNIPVPAGMNVLSLKIGPQARPDAFAQTYPLGTGTGQIMLPRRMTLVPSDMNAALSVRVEGLLGNKTVVSRLVNTKFIKGQSKLLHIELLQKCVGQVCPNDQTCTPSATCANPYVEPADLPTFDPTKDPSVPGLDPDAGVSLDAPLDQSTSDGKNDGLSGKDGLGFDGQPRFDGTPSAPEDGRGGDGPSVDLDGSVVNLDTATAVDAPITVSDVPPSSKTKGVACQLSGECESGLCVDGVCCEGKCDGMCMACNLPGKLGTCAAVPLNDPSNGDCPDDGVATCGRNGRCNGTGGCMMYPMGVACSAETCPAGTSDHTRQGLCDGEGHCGNGQPQNCAPFLCNPTTKTCNPTCTYDSDCVSPNKCNGGSCGKKSKGLPCSAPADCQSDICAQGVCCGDPCTDVCKSCAVEGSLGTCTNVPAGKPDLQSRCQDQGVATCGTNGMCNGGGACQKYLDGLNCSSQCNAAAATFTTFACGAGTCNPGAPQSCSPYSCDGSGCKKSCSVPADCAPGFVCGAGGLCVRPPEDCMNGVDDDGDGQIDCADTDCQAGFTCVPVVPDGFKGPVELFDGAEASMPACEGSYPVYTYEKGWGSLQCPTNCNCRCGAVSGVTCDPPSLGLDELGDTELCGAMRVAAFPSGSLNTCMTSPVVVPAKSYNAARIVASKPSGGFCSRAVDSPAPPTWGAAARVCGVQAKGGAGCGADSICWPRPQPAFAPQACVFGEGNMTCPASGYVKKRDYFNSQSVSDTRTCSAVGCGCDDPSGVTCNASVDLFGPPVKLQLGCDSDLLGLTVVASSCKSLRADGSFSHYRVTVPDPPFAGGSCASTGAGTLTGACTPSGGQVTVCCVP
jgi:hypothetical protein